MSACGRGRYSVRFTCRWYCTVCLSRPLDRNTHCCRQAGRQAGTSTPHTVFMFDRILSAVPQHSHECCSPQHKKQPINSRSNCVKLAVSACQDGTTGISYPLHRGTTLPTKLKTNNAHAVQVAWPGLAQREYVRCSSRLANAEVTMETPWKKNSAWVKYTQMSLAPGIFLHRQTHHHE